jgi:Protein of unknown function (DUF3500)
MKKTILCILISMTSILLLSSCSLGLTKKSGVGTGMTTSSTDTVTVNPKAIEISSCNTPSSMTKTICLADALKKKLNNTQLATLQRKYTLEEAKKWSNFPQQMVQSDSKRIGLNFASMTSIQIQYAKALIKAAAGSDTDE